MIEDAIFGRYISGTSPLHRMDPRAKLVLSLVVVGIIFAAQNFVALAVCAIFVLGLYVISGISIGTAFRSIAPLLFIVVLTAILNIFFVGEGTVVYEWGLIRITDDGLVRALFLACRLVLLLLDMSLLTLTTTTLDITDAFEHLLAPLARIGVPAHELSMMIGIALRFLPQFVQEFFTIYRAQVARGANWSKGRLRMVVSLIVPLFTSVFRHAETLSLAMDARCYRGGGGRTRLHPLRYSKLDGCAVVICAILFVLIIGIDLIPGL